MANDKALGSIVWGFILILVGVILMGTLADSIQSNITLTRAGNETIAISSGHGATANADVITFDWFGNGTNHTGNPDVTLGIHVNFTKNGSVDVDGNIFLDAGSYNASYSYEGTDYVSDSTSRSLLPLVPLFFAIAVMLLGFFVAKRGFEGMGIMDK